MYSVNGFVSIRNLRKRCPVETTIMLDVLRSVFKDVTFHLLESAEGITTKMDGHEFDADCDEYLMELVGMGREYYEYILDNPVCESRDVFTALLEHSLHQKEDLKSIDITITLVDSDVLVINIKTE